MTLIGMFLNIGITSALLRYYNIHRSTSEKRKVVGTAFLFVIITGIAAWLLAALFAHPITRLLFSAAVPATYFLISFSSFTLGYITTVPNAYMQARESSGTLVLADAAMLFVILALNIYFVAIAQIGLVGILLSPLLGGSLRASVFAWRTIRHVGLAFSMARLRELVTFGAPLIFSNLALFTLNFSDRFFLQHFQSLQAVGIYAVGYKFGFLLNVVVIAPFAMMWQPRMYLIGRRPDREKIFSRIFVFYSLVLILGALALSLFGGAITQLMVDKRFASGKIVIPIIALAYVVYGVGYFLQAGLLLAVRTRTIGALSAVAALSNLGLNAVLIPQFGILGAAWATVLGFLVIAAGTCYFSWKSFATHLGVERVLKAFSVAVGLYILSLAISVSSPVAALLLKAMLLAMFPLLLGVTRSLSRDELASLHAGRHTVASFAVRILRPGQWRTGSV
jgi:O-antigen/teichoic acid export membrane protein